MKVVEVTVFVEVDDSCPNPVDTALDALGDLLEGGNHYTGTEAVLGFSAANTGKVSN